MTETTLARPTDVAAHTTDNSTQGDAVTLSQQVSDMKVADESSANKPTFPNDASTNAAPSAGFTAVETSLPNLSVTESDSSANDQSLWSQIKSTAGGVLNVAEQIGKGALNEVEQHPWQIAGDVAIGAGIGAAAVALAPGEAVAAGIAGVVLAAGAGYEIYQDGGITKASQDIVKGSQALVHDTEVAFDPSKYSQADQNQADAGLQIVGDITSQAAAGFAGGLGGGTIAGAVKGAILSGAATDAGTDLPPMTLTDAGAGNGLEPNTITDTTGPSTVRNTADVPVGTVAGSTTAGPTDTPVGSSVSAAKVLASQSPYVKVINIVGPEADSAPADIPSAASTASDITNAGGPAIPQDLLKVSGAPALGDSANASGVTASTDAGSASSGENLGLQEFAKATGSDLNLANQLAEQAAAKGYGSPAYYAVKNLEDPAQIAQFARMYSDNFGDVAVNNMKFAVGSGRIVPGTESAWNTAIANITDSAATDSAATDSAATDSVATTSAAPATTAEGEALAMQEFAKSPASDLALANQLGTQAAADGFQSPSSWAVFNLTDPAQISQFARMYTENFGSVATENMNFALENEGVQPGTEDAWTAGLAKAKGATSA